MSVMSPVPSWSTLMRTSSVWICVQGVHDRTQRALDVGLEDDAQLLGLAGLDLAVEVLQRGAAGALGAGRLGLRGAPRRCAGHCFSSGTARRMSPAAGTSARPEEHHRGRRAGLR